MSNKIYPLELERWADSQVYLDFDSDKVLKYYFIQESWVDPYINLQNRVADALSRSYSEKLWYPLPVWNWDVLIDEVNLTVNHFETKIEHVYVNDELETLRKKRAEDIVSIYSSHGVDVLFQENGRRLLSRAKYRKWASLFDFDSTLGNWIKETFDPTTQLISRVSDIITNKCGVILTKKSNWFSTWYNCLNPVNIKYSLCDNRISLCVTDLASLVWVLLKYNTWERYN